MDLSRTAAVAARFEWLDAAGSTNTELVQRAAGSQAAEWPSGSVVATDNQTSGRGRLGRAWTAPPGTSLAVSLLLRPETPPEHWGWLPLLAGAAMTSTLRDAGADAGLKWPNDVLIGERKVCGILSEVVPGNAGVVVGAGLNHAMTAEQLPVPTATSLAVEGVTVDPDALIASYLSAVDELYTSFVTAGGDASVSGVYDVVRTLCVTIGAHVRADLPNGDSVRGIAAGLGPDGTLRIVPDNAEPLSIAAGDVTHLRYE